MTSPLTFTIQIVGTTYDIKGGSLDFHPQLEQRSKLAFTVLDPNNSFIFQKGQQITLTDSISSIAFTGTINTSIKYKVGTGNFRQHDIDCNDLHQVADERTTNKIYNGQYSGVIMAGMSNDVLSGDGITANYAIREDNTQTEFGQGTLSNTVATSNLGGDLELALAGSDVTIVESTTSNFGTGSLTNVTASNNSLAPTSTPAIKMVATQSVPQNNNSYTYVKIWQPGSSFQILSGRLFAYDIWVSSSSPQCKFGVDLIFTDGTTVRDNSVYNDAENIPPHPANDLSGVAKDQWYHREFYIDNFSGKYLAYVAIACEGDTVGTYTAYFKNIKYENNDHSVNQWFFSTSLGVNPAQQMQMNGYSNTQVSVVNTVDCYSGGTPNRISSAYSIDAAKIVKGSFLNWKGTTPPNTSLVMGYSIDGAGSYATCTNNAPLPYLLPGMSIAGKSIYFIQEFVQSPGCSPEQPNLITDPITGLTSSVYLAFTSLECVVYSSYNASKTDVLFATTSGWGGTKSNTTDNSYTLNLTGSTRNWDDGNDYPQGMYGGSGVGYCAQVCDQKAMSVTVDNNYANISRLDFAGTWANGIVEVDIYVETGVKLGITYRTTNWGNYDANYAYCIQVWPTGINLSKGSNSSASSNGTQTVLGSATLTLTSGSWYHLKVVFNGGSHTVYLNDVQQISISDSTYTSAGYIGLRVTNATGSTHTSQWDNFGVMAALSGTWVSANTSIASAGTYGTSVVWWDDISNDLSSVLVEASLNNGSSYATCTNGQPIPGLTAGQSLSGVSVKFRVTLTTSTASAMPGIQYFNAYVIGQFSSSGTRIAPVLSLAPALIAGSTVANCTAVTPTGTSVVLATSPDGSSWTNISNGDPIAGITTQPTPFLDTFSTNDNSSYTSTCRPGGSTGSDIWDTGNSRLTIGTGSNYIKYYSSIQSANIDIMLDTQYADCSGLVWRLTDTSNFYELDIYDASSNAGNTNIIQLYKVVSNVKTQIGTNATISFARGTQHRIRVVHSGTSITVHFDGVSVISTTDSSISASGYAGMILVSGVVWFLNFRIQPLGQSLSGVNAYTKVTLTSTDPTVTPQLTDLVLCALHPNIGLGAYVPTVDYRRTFFSANADDLAKKSDYYWQIDPSKALIFNPRTEQPAPWILTSNDVLYTDDGGSSTLSVENSGDLYRNRMILTGVITTIAVEETHPGDGKSTSWTLRYPVVGSSIPTISVNGQSKTIGQKGIDTGKDFYYALGSTSLAQDSSGAILEPVVDSFTISYVGQTTTDVVRNNTGGFPGTTSQAQYAALTGGAGIVEVVEDVSKLGLDVPGAQSYGDSQLQKCGVIGRTLICMTNRTGLSVGQYIPVFIPELDLNDASMLITDMDLTMEITLVGSQASMLYYWKLKCCEGPKLGSWQKTFIKAFK